MDFLEFDSHFDSAWRDYFCTNPTPLCIKNKRLEFILCNPAFYADFRITPEEVIGKTAASIIDSESYNYDYQTDIRLLNEGGYSTYKTKIMLKDLDYRHLEFEKFAMQSPNKEIIGILCRINDSTPYMNSLDEAKLTISKLNSIIESNDSFTNLLTHDIKNSLNGCFGLTEILGEIDILIQLDDSREIISTLNASIKRTINLLNSVLMWKNTRNGEMVFEPITANVYETVVSAILILEATRAEKEINLKTYIEATEFFTVDVNMFKTIIRNLIANAYAFSPKRSNVEVSYTKFNYEFHLQIKDEGHGMTQQEIDGLFNTPKKFQNKSHDCFNFSGIGLLLVKEFVEKHKGRIEVDSEIGRGTTISVIIPNQQE